MGILSLLIFLPVAGMLLTAILPARFAPVFRAVALGVVLAQAGIFFAGILPSFFGGPSGYLFREDLSWIRMGLGDAGELSIRYSLGVDGLSILMLALCVIILPVAVLSSWKQEKMPRAWFMLILLLDATMIGSFCALDLFLFYLFFEFMLIPMFFLIGIWGYERKEYAAIKFFLFTLLGSIFLLLVMVGMAFSFIDPAATLEKLNVLHPGNTIGSVQAMLREGTLDPSLRVFTFGLQHMLPSGGMLPNAVPGSVFGDAFMILGLDARALACFAVLFAFLVKVPSVPVHTWLPDAHVQAPTAVSVILAGVLLKIGGYGILRFAFGMFPEQLDTFRLMLAVLGWISLLYAGMVAISQQDLKSMIAWSSVSHMGFVLLGIASANSAGVQGAVLQMFNHGIVSAALFLIVGVLSDRMHDRQIASYSGLWSRVPVFAAVVMVSFFASMGMPGLNAFVSELLVFMGLFGSAIRWAELPSWIALTAVAGILISAVLYLRTYRRMFFGTFAYRGDDSVVLQDLGGREKTMLYPLVAMMIVLGLFPSLLTGLSSGAVASFIRFLSEHATLHP